MSHVAVLREIGSSYGRAVTDTLYVSPEGANSNGKTWKGAFTTIQGALAVASTDGDDCTLILISPHATHYNINTTDDPTYTGNYILQGTKRNWAKVMNTHASATSVLKFTGKTALIDLNFNLGGGSNANVNGVIMTHGGSRITRCQFVGEDLTAIRNCIHLDHASTGKHAKIIDVDILGNITYCRGVLVDNFARSRFRDLRIHECLEGIQIVGATSDLNSFENIDIGGCSHVNGIAINIDGGDEQHFDNITFHHNTMNVDDEEKNHFWSNIHGQFPIEIDPDDLTGELVVAGAGSNNYGDALTIFSTNEIDAPFRIVGVTFEPTDSEWYMVRFSGDAGTTYHDMILFDGTKREGTAAPSGTEFIFNAGTELYCQAKSETGGNNIMVWVEIQKI